MTSRIDIDGTTFRDEHGRHLILRGVNLGGDTKVPSTPDARTFIRTDFADHRTVSFVGRPAPLDEIDAHLARLRHWGFNCLRLLTTWEAIEHAGPGIHDEAYLDYYAEVCRRAGRHGLRVFVDFHQDAWARPSGGDGAPGWTFEVAGLDFTKFAASNAAHIMQHRYDPAKGGRQDSYQVMSWSGNYARPANAVMWTLFFAGNDLAPALRIEGRGAQDYLQDHFLGAVGAVAERVAGLDNVIGFDSMNEPSAGYIGKGLTQPIFRYRGPIWSALNGLALASGFSRDLPVIAPGKGVVGQETLNPDGVSIWLPGREDPFRAAGVWDVVDGVPVALKEDHFRRVKTREVTANADYMTPFFGRVADTIRGIRPDWLLFAELDPFEMIAGHGFPANGPDRTVNASHWYDLMAMVTKRFDPAAMTNVLTGQLREGPQAIEDGYADEMGRIAETAQVLNGGRGAPTLLGECGIQYDMNEAEAYRLWAAGERDPAIWSAQTTALDLMYNAIDRLLLSNTQWNYTASNSNDPMIADGWNQEDLSIWSADQVDDPAHPDAGGRAIEGFCRPYVRAAQGTLLRHRFDRAAGTFEVEIDALAAIPVPTEIYVPAIQFPDGFTVACEGGTWRQSEAGIEVDAAADGPLTVRIARA